nr:1,4-dihydroxy-2-naphthoyl-CoA thioesterase 1-like [Ipomoea batatas]
MDPSSSSSKSKTETLDRTLHAVGFEIGELTPSKVTKIKDRDIGSDTPRRGVRDRRADDEQEALDRTLHAVGFEIGKLTPSKVTERLPVTEKCYH